MSLNMKDLFWAMLEVPPDMIKNGVSSMAILTALPLEDYYLNAQYLDIDNSGIIIKAVTLEDERNVITTIPKDLIYLVEIETDDEQLRFDYGTVFSRRRKG